MPFLSLRASQSPHLPALITENGHKTLTYAELDEFVNRIAAALWAQGLRPGARLGAWMDNSPEYAALIHAALRLGLTLVPLNRRLSEPERTWQIQTAACQQVITPQHSLWRSLPKHPAPIAPTPLPDQAPVTLMFTSGTTGTPKGALLTLGNHAAAAQASSERLGTQPGERWLLTLPLYHIGGMSILFRACHDGLTVLLQDSFDAPATYRLLWEGRANLVSLVPTMLHRLIPYIEKDGIPPTLRLILLGGAATPPTLLTRALSLNLPIALTYGLTEACAQAATALPQDVRRKPGSAGKPLPGMQLHIVDENGHPCPPGQVGEITLQGPSVMPGYDGHPPLPGGVLHTGDLGMLDADGDLWVLTRRTDLIITGGENVYPEEVERALLTHPAVSEACVVGLPDPEWGQRVAAAVVLQAPCTPEDLLAHLRPQLAGYKLPRQITPVQSLPRTTSGKVMRARMAHLLQTLSPAQT